MSYAFVQQITASWSVVRRLGALALVCVFAAVPVRSVSAAPPSHPELNPLFAAEWRLRGHTTLLGWDGEPTASDGVDAIGAWPGSSGEGVVVAVADSGVDPITPALRGQLLPGRGFLTGRALTRDPLGHGTRVATLIAGNPPESDGIFGVAPGAHILPLRIATAAGHVRGTAALAALAYATRNPQVRVINTSWKGDFRPALERALAAAVAFPAGTLKIADGTSMAAPIVSGVAALLFARYPEASAAQVKQAIVASCTPVPELTSRVGCGGIVDAPAALAALAAVLEHTQAMRSSDGRGSGALAQAARIRAEVDARYRRPRRVRLAVTEASSTGVIDSFTLFTDQAAEPRVVPAANGIYYAVCPVGANCPYPGRAAKPPAAFLPRRAALELAVRTFLETSADLVAVSLPTRQFVLLILERADVIGKVDARALHAALRADPAAVPAPSLQRMVEELTGPHLFAPSALIPVSDTGETLVASSLSL